MFHTCHALCMISMKHKLNYHPVVYSHCLVGSLKCFPAYDHGDQCQQGIHSKTNLSSSWVLMIQASTYTCIFSKYVTQIVQICSTPFMSLLNRPQFLRERASSLHVEMHISETKHRKRLQVCTLDIKPMWSGYNFWVTKRAYYSWNLLGIFSVKMRMFVLNWK